MMMIDYSGYELSRKELYSFILGGYSGISAVLYLFYHSLFFSFAGGILVLSLLPFYKQWKSRERRTLLITQFKDMLYSLSSYAAANIQLSQALGGCLDNLLMLYEKDSPLTAELEYMVRNITENKESEIRLLEDFAERSCCEDIRNFVQVYKACAITGGDMENVLKNTIEILMDKINIEREIHTLTAQKKLEGNIITIIPLFVILLLNVVSPDYIEPLYTTFSGRALMSAALVCMAAAHFMIRRMTAIEV